MNNFQQSILFNGGNEQEEEYVKKYNKFVKFEPISIGATRILLSSLGTDEEIKDIINSVCKGGIITREFMNNYARYVTPEGFSGSPCLSLALITQYPHLFDYDVWFNNPYISASVILSDGFEEDDILPILKNIYYQDLEKYSNEIYFKFARTSRDAAEYMLANFPSLNVKALTDDISLINEAIFQNQNIIKSIKEDPEIVDKMINAFGNDITLNFVLGALSIPNNGENIGWQLDLIRRASQMELKVVGDITPSIISAVLNVNETLIPKVIQLVSEKNNEMVPYAALMQVINCGLDEEALCELSGIFVRNGGGGPLLKYAVNHKYELLTQVLQFNLI